MHATASDRSFPLWATLAALLLITPPLEAQVPSSPASYLGLESDPENCLSCHRFRGLSRLDPPTQELRLFFCSAEYYAYRQGPHARLRCTACHERKEVMVIPHQVKTPVDCTRTCHIVPASGVEIRFSHQSVADSLEQSAHSRTILSKLTFDRPLLRPGQSTCLYCHDQPMFPGRTDLPEAAPCGNVGMRCDTCHNEELPVDTSYYASHVLSRLQPARPLSQLAQTCAVCHSDLAIIAQMKSHDTVASYLHSFHGKAKLLGSAATATCVNCHASEDGNIHAMLGKEDPRSSIHESQLPTTCRTTACHPGAPPGMTEAAVHLDLNPAARTPEFYVAALFVTLTAAVMIVYFVLILLELISQIVRPRHAEHERLVRLAHKLQGTREGRALLMRMSVHERIQHWVLVINFVLLVATGMPIKFADHAWSAKLIGLMGGLSWARFIHRVCGVILLAAFVYHLGYLTASFVRRVRKARADGKKDHLWRMLADSPMVVTPQDVRQFGQLFLYLLFRRRERPRFGHFNFMQKFEYWAVFWGMPVMGLSGLALWGAPWVSEFVSGRVLNFAFIIHSDEAYLAFIYIAVVHMFSVIFAPSVFPLSLGSLSGQVPAEELAEGHSGALEQVAARLNVAADEPRRRRWRLGRIAKQLVRRTYCTALLGVCVVIGFYSLRFLASLLFTRQAAPVEIVEIPKRLDATVLRPQRDAAQPAASKTPPRGPLAHFHSIPPWFQADPGNDCTTSGCHAPLPHGRRVEVRAFLNMHATFVDCAVCHVEGGRAERAQWYALSDQQPRAAPAVLELAALLEQTGEIEAEKPNEVNERLKSLLRKALDESPKSTQFADWLLRLETTNVQSKLWQSTLAEMRQRIVMHVHGEYNAKIGLYEGDRRLGKPTHDQKAAASQFVAQKDALSASQRKPLLDAVHKDILPVGAMCTPCHSASPPLIDLHALGYPPARVQALQGHTIVKQVLSVEQGQPFHLPELLEGGGAR